MHPLNGPRLKIQRAIEHLEPLKKLRDDFGKANPCKCDLQTRGGGADGTGEFIFIVRTGLADPRRNGVFLLVK